MVLNMNLSPEQVIFISDIHSVFVFLAVFLAWVLFLNYAFDQISRCMSIQVRAPRRSNNLELWYSYNSYVNSQTYPASQHNETDEGEKLKCLFQSLNSFIQNNITPEEKAILAIIDEESYNNLEEQEREMFQSSINSEYIDIPIYEGEYNAVFNPSYITSKMKNLNPSMRQGLIKDVISNELPCFYSIGYKDDDLIERLKHGKNNAKLEEYKKTRNDVNERLAIFSQEKYPESRVNAI